jgi:hypothetical protein
MAVISLSKSEMQSISKIGSMLAGLSKVIGDEQWNEFKVYDELEAEKLATKHAQRKQFYAEKSSIEKLL